MLLRLLAAVSWAGAVLAQTGPLAPASNSPQRSNPHDSLPRATVLDEVRVTAQWDPTTQSAGRLTGQRIDLNRQRSLGVASVVEALAFHPTVRVSRDAMIGTSVQIGAMPAASTLVLLDGVPITGHTDGRVDLSTMTTLGIDRVEVVTGPMAHFYGSGSAAGVVNFITRHAKREAQVQSSVSSIGTWQTGIRVADPKMGNLYAERQFFDGWDPQPEGKRSRAWDQSTTFNVRHSGQVRRGSWLLRHHLSGSWDQIKDRGDRRSPYTAFATDRWIETWRSRIQGDAWHPRWHITAAYDAADRTIARYNRNLVERTQTLVPEAGNPDPNRFGDGMLRVAHLSAWRKLGSSPYQGRWVAAYHGQLQFIEAARMNEPSMHQVQHGVLGEYDIKSNRRQIELGLRGQQIPGTLAWNPSLQWTEFRPNGQFRINASGGFRAPELKERYLWFFDASHQIAGNPNLKPERSRQASASWTDRSRRQFEAQYVVLTDAIQLARQPGGTYTYVNLDSWSSTMLSASQPWSVRGSQHEVHVQALWSRMGSESWRPSPSLRLQSSVPLKNVTVSFQHQTQWGLWFWTEGSDERLTANRLGLTHHAQASVRWQYGIWSIVASGHNLWNQSVAGLGGHSTGLGGLPMPGRHYRLSINLNWK